MDLSTQSEASRHDHSHIGLGAVHDRDDRTEICLGELAEAHLCLLPVALELNGAVGDVGRFGVGAGKDLEGSARTRASRSDLGERVALSLVGPFVDVDQAAAVSIVDRIGLSIQRLTEVYAETNIVVFLARKRVGGKLLEPFKLKVQKVSA